MQLSAIPTVDSCHNNLPTSYTNQQTKQHTVVIKSPLRCGIPSDEMKSNNSRLSLAKMVTINNELFTQSNIEIFLSTEIKTSVDKTTTWSAKHNPIRK